MTHSSSRIAGLDMVRSLACALMISYHVPIPFSPGSLAVKAVYNYLGLCCIPLFFMLSGVLALNTRRPLWPYLRGRLLHIALPMVVWTIVFLAAEAMAGRMAWPDVVRRSLLIPVAPQASVFWFIYVLMGLYCLAPLAAHWLQQARRREVEILLALWALTLLLPFAKLLCPLSAHMVDLGQGWLHYFQGYGGMMLLGYYLHRWVAPSAGPMVLATVAVLSIAVPAGIYAAGLPHELVQGNATLPVAVTAAVLFVLCLRAKPAQAVGRIVEAFARRSYGVYLVHITIVHQFMFPVFGPLRLDYCWQVPLLTVLTAAMAWALVWVIDQVPGGHYTTGTRM